MSTFQTKITGYCKEIRKHDLFSGGKVVNSAQMLDLANKDFKAAILNVFKELKENMALMRG